MKQIITSKYFSEKNIYGLGRNKKKISMCAKVVVMTSITNRRKKNSNLLNQFEFSSTKPHLSSTLTSSSTD